MAKNTLMPCVTKMQKQCGGCMEWLFKCLVFLGKLASDAIGRYDNPRDW